MKLLLDVHYSPTIARELVRQGHDVVAAVSDEMLSRLPDEALLESAVEQQRALVTNNARDLVPITADWARMNRDHFGLVLTSDSSMPRTRDAIGQFIRTLGDLLERNSEPDALRNHTLWLQP